MPADYEHHAVCSVQFSGTEDYYIMSNLNEISVHNRLLSLNFWHYCARLPVQCCMDCYVGTI